MFDPDWLRRVGRVATFLEPFLVSFLFGFVAVAVLARVSMALARLTGAMARPDHRSLHDKPTPRLGGLAVGGGFLIGLALLEAWPSFDARLFPVAAPLGYATPLLIGALAIMLLGLADDLFGMNPWLKLFAQVFLASWFLHLAGSASRELSSTQPFNLGLYLLQFPGVLSGWLSGSIPFGGILLAGFVLSTLWIVLFLNMANFLDGADGQAALFGLVLGAFGVALFATSPNAIRYLGQGYHGSFFICLHLLAMGCCVGFLLYNFPPADTFLGDCGSHFLGFLWGVTTLWMIAEPRTIVATQEGRFVFPACGLWELLGVLAAVGPFLFDFLFTLVRRFLAGHSITQPHRDHLYQRLALTGLSHRTLLSLHLPYYVLNATAGLVLFHEAFPLVAKLAALAASIASMVAYHGFVLRRERAAG